MKKQKIITSIFLTLILSSCGFLNKSETPEETSSSTTPDSMLEADAASTKPEVKSEFESSSDDLFAESNSKEPASAAEPAAEPTVAKTDEPSNITTNQDQPIQIEEVKPIITEEKLAIETPTQASGPQKYKVQKGETLMQISFKLYGDVSRWKELKQMNSNKFSKNTFLTPNSELNYMPPAQEFIWNPKGTAYLIKSGETLGTISNSVYQTPKKWKKIWENNKPLIKNPNIIYAGFTVFYPAAGEVAEANTSLEINKIDQEISNIQSSTERTTTDISPLAE